jgi:hypothetical protein
MNNVTFKVGDLVRPTHNNRVGIVVRFYDNGLYGVMFENGHTYTCFLKDLVAL